jgi:putative SOS response-associated peptidase YedK
MCARYDLHQTRFDLIEHLLGTPYLDIPVDTDRDVLPSTFAPIIPSDTPTSFVMGQWGFQPVWAKQILINARSDNALSSKMWSKSMAEQRCVIVATGWYETRTKEKAGAAPNRYLLTNRTPLFFAGLYHNVRDGSETVKRFAIMTTDANELAAKVHNRMPAILPPHAVAEWLDTKQVGAVDAAAMLQPYPGNDILVEELPAGYYKRFKDEPTAGSHVREGLHVID